MTIPRFIMGGFIASVLLVSPAAVAEQPTGEPSLHDVTWRVDKILQRLEQIDRRIGRLENMLLPIRFRLDKNGILRDASGRPIGVWGVDHPNIEERAVR